MVGALAEPRPGGLNSGMIVIGALKPGFRWATIFRFIEPFCTSGALGSTTVTENGASSVTATAVRSTVQRQKIVWLLPMTSGVSMTVWHGALTLASTGLAVIRVNRPSRRASAFPPRTTG